MDEEMKKVKYRVLLKKLYTIKSKYEELDDIYNNLNSSIRSNLMVNDNSVVEDEFIKINNTSNYLDNELTTTIIPIVRSKS